jgi:hypothetical protein
MTYLNVTSDLSSPKRKGNDPDRPLESKSNVSRLERLIKDTGNVDVRRLLLRRKSRRLVRLPIP